ncbi:MAG: PSD1 and planctomycete cytochrome C domain-containing protein [Bacteroidota bacterium]
MLLLAFQRGKPFLHVLLFCGCVWVCACNPRGNTALPEVVDYNYHIRPILSDKCFTCHGPDAGQRKAGLRLDTEAGQRAALEDAPDHFVLVPGQPEASSLLERVRSEDPHTVMPPPEAKLGTLTEQEVALINRWIEQGAEYKRHWAFITPEKVDPPIASDPAWQDNPVDAFVFAKMKEQGLKPNPPAEKVHWLKRVSFDLTGLPPTREQTEAFLADDAPDAYDKMVSTLLASPRYGERMAVTWLDVARYADSHGYQDDGFRTMWPWRDWVIHAFNENYPYDQFLRWQLAGDMIDSASKESILATGFNRNHKITQEGGVIDEEYRIEYVTDRTNTFGKAFLGLTFECAKCHDHKYDPISQEEYYSTFAFFDKVPEKGLFGVIDASFADPPRMEITPRDVEETLAFINLQAKRPVSVMVMKDSVGIRETRILNRGNYDSPTDTVSPTTPKAIMAFDTARFQPNRLGLTDWLLAPEHPLTARVFVNRVWNEFFGRGLVNTVGDFGMQGELPSHGALLDWLAVDFRENDWDIQRLIRQIVLSQTYRQSAQVRKDHLKLDPGNIYLARMPRIRLSAETVRDHVLASSGLLNPELGGPSVKPYQPEGVWESATSGRGTLAKYYQDHGEDLYRRGLYTFIKRTVPPPSMLIFDASNRDQCEVARNQTNTPLQALVMLNDPQVLEAARVLAERLAQDTEPEAAIESAFWRILCRPPSEHELAMLTEYYASEQAHFETEPEKARELLNVGEHPHLADTTAQVAALMQVIHTLYNMEEAIVKT